MRNIQSKVTISYNIYLMYGKFADKITLMEYTKRKYNMKIFHFPIKVDKLFEFTLPN